MPNNTIFALSSGQPPCGVAVIRISGPSAFDSVRRMSRSLPAPRQAALRSLYNSKGQIIDKALVIAFEGPASFTGEDCVELHVHGSKAVISALFAELESLPELRMAEAGEFSRRAFENGRLDLIEVEGLKDLITADTEMQRRLAVEHGFGGQSALYQGWADRLVNARALIEAELDFADEDDVPGSVSDRVWSDMTALAGEISSHIATAKAGEIIRDGFKVVITGPPNAGKSSLLNAIAQRDVAIVTEIAGTTRDVLQVDVDLDGYLVRFFDTAGLRESSDIVEQEGIRRARAAASQADLVLDLHPADSPQKSSHLDGVPGLVIGTKRDVCAPSPGADLYLSSHTGEGLDELKGKITALVRSVWSGSLAPSRSRHIGYLREAFNFIEEALNNEELDLKAESLRLALTALGRITGRVDADELLGVIFSQFCIGK